MDKKVIALIIVAVIVVGAYGGYYAYATMVIQPEDLNTFKDELSGLSSGNNSTGISEDQIVLIESNNALTLISQSQREAMAANLTAASGSGKAMLEEVKENITSNQNKASRYDIILKSDVANDIRAVYNQKILDLTNQMIANLDKQATDIKNGDTAAYVNDLREYNKLVNEYNAWRQQAIGYLQDIVNKLGG
ncbi:MAG: hypothetical protein LLF83_05270 [Methanobacterium sp.]|nr:hypothetical protein [Methanobacterium sp.]